jgi:hypothetical protein
MAHAGVNQEVTEGGTFVATAPDWIPCCLRCIVQKLYYDMLAEDDGYFDRLRKMWLFFFAFIAYSGFSYILTVALSNNFTPAIWIACVSSFVYMCVSIPAVIYMRSTKTASVGLFDLCFAALAFMVAAQLLSDHQPGMAICSVMETVIILLNSPRVPFFMVTCTVLLTLALYNDMMSDARRSQEGLPLLKLPGHTEGAPVSSLALTYLGTLVATQFVMILLRLAVVELSTLLDRAESTSIVATKVASKLGHYKTEDAKAILNLNVLDVNDSSLRSPAKASTSASGESIEILERTVVMPPEVTDLARHVQRADADLLSQLRAIASNLEKYRPHLPNWVIEAAMLSESSASDGDGQLPARTAGDDSDLETISSVPTETSPRTGNQADNGSFGRKGSSPGAFEMRDAPRDKSSPRGRSDSCCDPMAKYDSSPTMTRAHRVSSLISKQVARAFIDVHPTTESAALHAAVDLVHDLARATRAAVHSFIGDRLDVTWNAAQRVAQPEEQAARFLARLRAAAHQRGDALPKLTGAAAVGPATTLMAGRTGRTQTLAVRCGRWQSTLEILARVATRGDTFVVTGAIAGSVMNVEMRGVAAVRVTGSVLPEATGGGRSADALVTKVFEVVNEMAVSREEWMYVIAERAHGSSISPNTTISNALDLAVAGNYTAALASLSSVLPIEGFSSSLVADLHRDVSDIHAGRVAAHQDALVELHAHRYR